MAEATRLDAAQAAMVAAPEDEGARRAFYADLAASELFLLLEEEATGGNVTPRSFEVEGQGYVFAFDREERLARFAGGAAPYAALTGRALAGMLAPAGLGLALNPEAASAALLPAEAMAWLAETLAPDPERVAARLAAVHPPGALPQTLLAALDARLAGAVGLARCAWLMRAEYTGGGGGHMVAVIDPQPGAEPALARMLSDLWRLSADAQGPLDVVFLAGSDPAAERVSRVGLRFDLPRPAPLAGVPGAAPGMDPDVPPRLR